MRNTILEEETADARDSSLREFETLREDVLALVGRSGRAGVARAVEKRFEAASFPFRRGRAVRRITIRGSVGEISLEPGFRRQRPWTIAEKRSIIARGYELTDRELRTAGVDREAVGASS
jgi:hypothetical protein